MPAYTVMLSRGMTTGNNVLAGLTGILVSGEYTFSAAHATLSDIPAAAREASAELSNLQVVDGRLTADPTTWASAAGDAVRGIVLHRGSDLVWFHNDFGSGEGQTTLELNGSDIRAVWSPDGVIAFV